MELLLALKDDYTRSIQDWPTADYDWRRRAELINRSVADLGRGIPPTNYYKVGARNRDVRDADMINAAWIERARSTKWPVSQLLTKALDSMTFLRVWASAGGTVSQAEEPGAPGLVSGMLSGPAIKARLRRRQAPLVIRPLLLHPDPFGTAALDVRLGSQFIVFHRAGTPFFATLGAAEGARSTQRKVEVGWGEKFVLHPNELVIAGTLEYVAIPADMAAQVVTRSSYGRLGLITATAVQVHPHFRGCLTLELLNLGEVPLELTPGERIAQLVFFNVRPSAPEPDPPDYSCPIGPEFYRPRQHPDERRVLEMMRDRARS
jgi:deoxycytidine triphosphate deaminase